MVDYTEQRKHMINSHLLPSGVSDPFILKAVEQIHRENFLPDNLKSLAYLDDDIKLDASHFLLRPNDLLRMIVALRITTSDKVLDIGCTTGYSTVIMAFLCHNILGLEENHAFIEQAKKLASVEGIHNANFISGTYEMGYPTGAPFDCILLQRAYHDVPEKLTDQLNDNGRLVYIKQSTETYGQACLVEKHHGTVNSTPLFELCVPYFHQSKPGFTF